MFLLAIIFFSPLAAVDSYHMHIATAPCSYICSAFISIVKMIYHARERVIGKLRDHSLYSCTSFSGILTLITYSIFWPFYHSQIAGRAIGICYPHEIMLVPPVNVYFTLTEY